MKQFSGTTPGNRHRGTTPKLSFPKKKRLVNNRQFKAVLARNLHVSDDLLTLYMAENDCGYARLGVSVSKSCGGAVVRNRLKRLLREAFRQSQDRIPADFDYLLMISSEWLKKVKNSADSKVDVACPSFEQVSSSFLALLSDVQKRLKKSNN